MQWRQGGGGWPLPLPSLGGTTDPSIAPHSPPPKLPRQLHEHWEISGQGVGELTQSGGRLLGWGAGGAWRTGARAEPRRL